MDGWTAGAMLLVAFAIDRWLGEPPVWLHPVVGMGRYLRWAGHGIAPAAGQCDAASGVRSAGAATVGQVAQGVDDAQVAQVAEAVQLRRSGAAAGAAGAADWRRFIAGALAWSAGAATVLALAILCQRLLAAASPWVTVVLGALLLKPLFAWRMLREETATVESALSASLAAGRSRLARLVSRDVRVLDEAGVRESAIESLAENLNDSVVAPVFWFLVAGLPGAALYRFANTADAMWGYRGARGGRDWAWAGKFAARADDLLSWVPARITAGLLVLASGGRSARGLAAQASLTPSPNGGWPMAAMALALGVRLRKPGVYTLNAGGRTPETADAARAQVLAARAVALGLGLALGLPAVRGMFA